MRYLTFLLILLLLSSASAMAQSVDASGLATLRLIEDEARGAAVGAGIGGAMSFPVAPALRIEGQVLWFPASEASFLERQGGQMLSASVGGRVRVKENARVAIDGVLQAGFMRFDQTYYVAADERAALASRTHLALDFGGTFQWMPEGRFSPRVDVLSRVYSLPKQSAWETLVVNAGISYRLQRRPPVAPTPSRVSETVSKPRRLSMGGEVGYMNSTAVLDVAPLTGGGLGVFASYRVLPGIFADGSVMQYLSEPFGRTPWDGGKPTQILGGVKAGFTRDRVGFYIKARWGVHSAPGALVGRDNLDDPYEVRRANNLAFDLGEVIEVRSGRRVLRFEASDLMLDYGRTTIRRPGRIVPQPGVNFDALHAGVGFGWMF